MVEVLVKVLLLMVLSKCDRKDATRNFRKYDKGSTSKVSYDKLLGKMWVWGTSNETSSLTTWGLRAKTYESYNASYIYLGNILCAIHAKKYLTHAIVYLRKRRCANQAKVNILHTVLFWSSKRIKWEVIEVTLHGSDNIGVNYRWSTLRHYQHETCLSIISPLKNALSETLLGEHEVRS